MLPAGLEALLPLHLGEDLVRRLGGGFELLRARGRFGVLGWLGHVELQSDVGQIFLEDLAYQGELKGSESKTYFA